MQLSLFDQRDLAEITAPEYPGERLIVCRNPDLAAERRRKREELLRATEQDLAKLRAAALLTYEPHKVQWIVAWRFLGPCGALHLLQGRYLRLVLNGF